MIEPSPSSPAVPIPLQVAGWVAVLEGALVLGYAVAGLVSVSGHSPGTGVAAAVFFVVYGVALGYFGLMLRRLKSWARSPVVLAQLIQVLAAWDFTGGRPTPLFLGLVVAAVVVLIGVFHPASLRALGGAGDRA